MFAICVEYFFSFRLDVTYLYSRCMLDHRVKRLSSKHVVWGFVLKWSLVKRTVTILPQASFCEYACVELPLFGCAPGGKKKEKNKEEKEAHHGNMGMLMPAL